MGEQDSPTGRSTREHGGSDAFLITGAPQPYDEQHRARVRKYLILMAFRVPALIIAGIVYSSTGSGLLALAIIAASIPLPWIAVLIANDRPPRKRGEHPNYMHGPEHDVLGPASLGATFRVIDTNATYSDGTTPGGSADTDSTRADSTRADSTRADSTRTDSTGTGTSGSVPTGSPTAGDRTRDPRTVDSHTVDPHPVDPHPVDSHTAEGSGGA